MHLINRVDLSKQAAYQIIIAALASHEIDNVADVENLNDLSAFLPDLQKLLGMCQHL